MNDSWVLNESQARKLVNEFLLNNDLENGRIYSISKIDDFGENAFGSGGFPLLVGAKNVWEFGIDYNFGKNSSLVCGNAILVFVNDATSEIAVFYRI